MQLTVTQFPEIGLEGQLADSGFHDITPGIVDSALDHGRFVVLGANGYQSIKLPGASADVTNTAKGVVLYRAMKEPCSPHFNATETADVLRVGRIYVVPQGDMTDEGPVYVIYSGANAGKVRADAGSGGNAAVLEPRAKMIKGGAAGSVCILSVNLP